ncbi:MAG: hypothetical protein ACKON7_06330 [Planctomycetaceae bacterium]
MKSIRTSLALVPVWAALCAAPASAQQCCLGGLFAGCGSCFRTAPTYAVAPVAAPMVAPIPAPPPPVMVPVQQTSYVPETTYRTQYQCVPVTTYKPSCEVDPCTGCPTECMQPVTQYVQQAVNVPVTQYRAVTTTKYVQMQPGYAPGAVAAPVAYPAGPALPGPATPAASPFATPAAQPAPPVQTSPQGGGAAGADGSQQLQQGQPSINPPALPATGYPATQVVPQAGTTYMPPAAAVQPQPTAPPTLAPTPAMKPIPELPRTTTSGTALPAMPALPTAPVLPTTPAAPATGTVAPPSLLPGSGSTAPGLQPSTSGGTPMLQGNGPTGATRAFPRLLEPTHHTTSWQPATDVNVPATFMPAYPTAALPSRLSR